MEKVQLKELGRIVEAVLAKLPKEGNGAGLVTLQGNLGTGKTTFVQNLGKKLGIEETIQSPTYVLMKSYAISFGRFTTLVHIDAYRLQSPEEFLSLKPEEFLKNPHALVVMEWPERAQGMLPPPDVRLNFSSDGAAAEERYIEVRSRMGDVGPDLK